MQGSLVLVIPVQSFPGSEVHLKNSILGSLAVICLVASGCGDAEDKAPDATATPSPTDPKPGSPGANVSSTAPCERGELDKAVLNLAPEKVTPTAWVGTGTPGSCTEASLRTAFLAGGVIGFKCGDAKMTIPVAEVLAATKSVTLDGGGKITIDGQNKTRLFLGAKDANLILMNMTLTKGQTSDDKGAAAIHTGWRGNVGLVNVTLEQNKSTSKAERAGGALSTHEGLSVVYGSTFRNNTGPGNGGGINNLLSSLYVFNSTFESNTTEGTGGAIYSDGNAFYDGAEPAARAKTMPRMMHLCGSKFLNNTAASSGAAYLFLYADKVDPAVNDSIKIDKSLVKGNTSSGQHAGGLYVQGGGEQNKVSVRNSAIIGNAAQNYGGGLVIGVHSAELENVTFYGNTTLGDNGQGAAIFLEKGDSKANNLTVVKNKARKAGGALSGAGKLASNNSLFVDNEVTEPWNKDKNNCHTALNTKGEGNFQYLTAALQSSGCHADIEKSLNPFKGGIPEPLDNGGPVPTVALAKDSPVAGKGVNCSSTDARMKTRPAKCDPGAFQNP